MCVVSVSVAVDLARRLHEEGLDLGDEDVRVASPRSATAAESGRTTTLMYRAVIAGKSIWKRFSNGPNGATDTVVSCLQITLSRLL